MHTYKKREGGKERRFIFDLGVVFILLLLQQKIKYEERGMGVEIINA